MESNRILEFRIESNFQSFESNRTDSVRLRTLSGRAEPLAGRIRYPAEKNDDSFPAEKMFWGRVLDFLLPSDRNTAEWSYWKKSYSGVSLKSNAKICENYSKKMGRVLDYFVAFGGIVVSKHCSVKSDNSLKEKSYSGQSLKSNAKICED